MESLYLVDAPPPPPECASTCAPLNSDHPPSPHFRGRLHVHPNILDGLVSGRQPAAAKWTTTGRRMCNRSISSMPPFLLQNVSQHSSHRERRVLDRSLPKRWTTTLPSKVNLHNAIKFRSLCGAILITYPAYFRGNETLLPHRVVGLREHQRRA